MSLKKIFLLRHAESDEDINPNIRNEVSDENISITPKGKQQLSEITYKISEKVQGFDEVKIITSPSNRAVQTAGFLRKNISTGVLKKVVIEKSIRNLDWGETNQNNVKQIEKERYEAGVLFYHFPGGDDSAVFVRNIQKFTDKHLVENRKKRRTSECLIIVTHGFALRVIVKNFTKMSNKKFKWLANPPNCFLAELSVEGGEVSLDTRMPIYRRT